jgi:hypothetical protein
MRIRLESPPHARPPSPSGSLMKASPFMRPSSGFFWNATPACLSGFGGVVWFGVVWCGVVFCVGVSQSVSQIEGEGGWAHTKMGNKRQDDDASLPPTSSPIPSPHTQPPTKTEQRHNPSTNPLINH